VAKYKIVLN